MASAMAPAPTMPTVSSESWLAPGATGPVGSPGSGPPGLGSACKVGAPRLMRAGGSSISAAGSGAVRSMLDSTAPGGRDDEGAAKWGRGTSDRDLPGRSMRAAVYDRLGPAAEVIRVIEVDRPEPGPGEVRVRVRLSGVNPTDWKSRSEPPPGPSTSSRSPTTMAPGRSRR